MSSLPRAPRLAVTAACSSRSMSTRRSKPLRSCRRSSTPCRFRSSPRVGSPCAWGRRRVCPWRGRRADRHRLPSCPGSSYLRAASRGAQEARARNRHHQRALGTPGARAPQPLHQGARSDRLEAPAFHLATQDSLPLRTKGEAKGSGDFSPFWSGEARVLGRDMNAKDVARAIAEEAPVLLRSLGSADRADQATASVIAGFFAAVGSTAA